MTEKQEIARRIGEIERKISDGEALLRGTGRAAGVGWAFIAVGLLMIVFLQDVFLIIGLIVVAASAWRLYTAARYRREIEEGLSEYRGRKAELNATLMMKD